MAIPAGKASRYRSTAEGTVLPCLLDDVVDLVGRERDLAVIRRFLREAERPGGTPPLLLWGNAGTGKTALLSAAGRLAADRGFRLLFAQGTEFEAEISYSGLQQLLLPFWDEVEQAPPPYREALRVALGFAAGMPPSTGLAVAATAWVLSTLTRSQPVLVTVDNIHWLDRATGKVLCEIVSRRLTADARVGYLATARTEHGVRPEHAGGTVWQVVPLPDADADSLLRRSFPDLDHQLRQRVLSVAQGNPLALLELARLGAVGPVEGPGAAPMSSRLLEAFGSAVETLDAPAQRLLLLAALDGEGAATAVLAASSDRSVADHIRQVTRAGIAYSGDGGSICFRHPLTARVVVQRATHTEVREAHRALGECYLRRPDGLERAAWHLAEAAISPDDEVAGLLERAARATLGRGDALSAIDSLVRAAALSQTRPGRTRRIAQAALLACEVTGNLRAAAEMLTAARASDPDFHTSLAAATAAASTLVHRDGDIDAAHRLLVSAVESYAHREAADDQVLISALATLGSICWYGGREELWAPYRAAVTRLRPAAPPVLYLCTHTYPDPARVTDDVLAVLSEQIRVLNAPKNPAEVIGVCRSACYFDRLDDCRTALDQIADNGRDGGAIASSINALYLIGYSEFMLGSWAHCRAVVTEGLDLADRCGYTLVALTGQHLLARLAAVEGNDDELADRLARMERWAVPRGIRSVTMFALAVRALAASGRADFQAAYRYAGELSSPGTFAAFAPAATLVSYELIEAAVRTGRHEQARAHAAAIERAGLATWSFRWELVAATCAALAANTGQSIGQLRTTLAHDEATRWPFDRGRGQLVVGAYLRRHNAVAESREFLSAAAQAFSELGAAPWTRRAQEELAATAAVRRSPRACEAAVLTPQQQEIAELAAGGMSNKQIAERLGISPRTVGNHLYSVFPKLGVRSRAGLRDALNETAK